VSLSGLEGTVDDGGHGGGCGCNFCRSVGVGPRDQDDAHACIHGTVAGYEFCALPPLRLDGPMWDPQVAPPTIEPVTTSPLNQTFQLHSRSSAQKVIYLDFNGHTTSNTFWNTEGSFVTPAYDTNGSPGSFTDGELRNIQDIWARVAEDFSPFDVDVTTEEPTLEDLRKFGPGDTRWGIRVCIGGGSSDWFGPPAGGVAFLTSFNFSSDTPCYVFTRDLANGNPKAVAEATSHEVGHALGLSHDGRTAPSEPYYEGHGSGRTSWAPIMGVGYYQDVVQWSRGDYAAPDNREDDLAIITTENGFGFRPDDYGGTTATAFAPAGLGTTPTTIGGVIEQESDVDLLRFTTFGRIRATITPAATSPNLDILAEIRDAAGRVLFTSNPVDALDASFDVTVAPGEYFLAVRGTGKGNPLTTGYPSYASLGAYAASIAVTPGSAGLTVAFADPAAATAAEGDAGTRSINVVVTRTGSTAAAATVTWSVAGSSAQPADAADFGGTLPGGTLDFAVGETGKTVTFLVQGDTVVEGDEGFTVTASGNGGSAMAAGLIMNDDLLAPGEAVLAVAALDSSKPEGNSGLTTYRFRVTRTGSTVGETRVAWVATGSGESAANADDFSVDAACVFPAGTLIFAAGETSQEIVIDIAADERAEIDETFAVQLFDVTGGQIGTAIATATIVNDDTSVQVAVSGDAAKAENVGRAGATFTVTVTRTGLLNVTSRVNWAVSGSGGSPASGADFAGGRLPRGSVTFAPRETTKTITVRLAGDTAEEVDEGFSLGIVSATGATVIGSAATATILNDDATFSIVGPAAGAEGNSGSTPFTFTVTRTGLLAAAATLRFATTGAATGGRAAANAADFAGNALPRGTLSFLPGQASATITVSVNGDAAVERDESFRVTLSNASFGRIGVASATGTILNDDAPSARLSAATFAAALGGDMPGSTWGKSKAR
jgi:hypothetical protein